eukprot:5820898-Prymnesium_polylepis.2
MAPVCRSKNVSIDERGRIPFAALNLVARLSALQTMPSRALVLGLLDQFQSRAREDEHGDLVEPDVLGVDEHREEPRDCADVEQVERILLLEDVLDPHVVGDDAQDLLGPRARLGSVEQTCQAAPSKGEVSGADRVVSRFDSRQAERPPCVQRRVLFPSRACHGGGRVRPGRAAASEQLFA